MKVFATGVGGLLLTLIGSVLWGFDVRAGGYVAAFGFFLVMVTVFVAHALLRTHDDDKSGTHHDAS